MRGIRKTITAVAALSLAASVSGQVNPYRAIDGWAKLPEGRTWGSTSAISTGSSHPVVFDV